MAAMFQNLLHLVYILVVASKMFVGFFRCTSFGCFITVAKRID